MVRTKVAKVFEKHPTPVLSPTQNWWEDFCVFNPAAVEKDGRVYLLYRAMGKDMVSRIGLAWSDDGVNFERLSSPVFEPSVPQEASGVEDPRVVEIDGVFYMTYTAYRGWDFENGDHNFVIAMAKSTDLRKWEKMGFPLGDEINKDGVLFPERVNGKYVLLHRRPPSIWIAFSDDLKSWEGHRIIMKPTSNWWENIKIGAGAPPIKTEEGWLLIYHGVGAPFGFRVYSLGVALLDLKDPTKVLARCPLPVLVPELIWETKGDVPFVVFTDGAVVRGDRIYLYYGAADRVIGLAVANLKDVLSLF